MGRFNRGAITNGAFIIAIGVVACSGPSQRIDELAHQQGYHRTVAEGAGFMHIAYIKGDLAGVDIVHVYLGGDGTPWTDRRRISRDPTPRNPLMLRLMGLDPSPGIYLGRPCYHGLNLSPPCTAALWTGHRYSRQVVDSMTAALERLVGTEKALVLLGYSGGGTLAMLLAERLPNVRGVVTVAANLDIDAWTRLHGYTPLRGSLNPALRPPLARHIHQLHIAGGRDRRVPAEIIRPVALRQHDARFLVLEEQDHKCCWGEAWPALLAGLENP